MPYRLREENTVHWALQSNVFKNYETEVKIQTQQNALCDFEMDAVFADGLLPMQPYRLEQPRRMPGI